MRQVVGPSFNMHEGRSAARHHARVGKIAPAASRSERAYTGMARFWCARPIAAVSGL
jgi:hypothetical protein